jgi:hypothetical protein
MRRGTEEEGKVKAKEIHTKKTHFSRMYIILYRIQNLI